MASYTEEMKGQEAMLRVKPDSVHTEKSVDSETQDLKMNISHGANSTSLNKAVGHLNRETQRGEHAPMVGGYLHDHTMR
jgi:sortase (surface protein transpeptidase)